MVLTITLIWLSVTRRSRWNLPRTAPDTKSHRWILTWRKRLTPFAFACDLTIDDCKNGREKSRPYNYSQRRGLMALFNQMLDAQQRFLLQLLAKRGVVGVGIGY